MLINIHFDHHLDFQLFNENIILNLMNKVIY